MTPVTIERAAPRTGSAGTSPVFRATSPEDEAPLIAFLARAFAMDTTAPFLDPPLMRWKFWQPRDDFHGPRSFVLERDGRIQAHVGLWPAVIERPEGRFTGIQMIDWASDPAAPGAGASVVRRLLQQYDFIYSIGGSEMTRRVLPALGFQKIADAWIAARPLRPIARRVPGARLGWKSYARIARNLWWWLSPASTASSGWTARPVVPGSEDHERWMSNVATIPRSAAFFNYLSRCPAAAVRVYAMGRGGEHQGHVALSAAHGQARVAGVWLAKPSAENLATAFGLAQHIARTDPSVAEVTAMGSTTGSEAAAIAAGLRIRERRPVYMLARKALVLRAPAEFQIADDDACFRYETPFT